MELIDTDVLIDVQRGFVAAADWFATDPDVGVPGFVVMELVQDACERRSKSAARGGVARPVEKCSAQLCSGVGQENRGGAAISPYRERGTRSVCSDGDVD